MLARAARQRRPFKGSATEWACTGPAMVNSAAHVVRISAGRRRLGMIRCSTGGCGNQVSPSSQGPQLLILDGARLILQHDRDSLANRIGKARGRADQLPPGPVLDERGVGTQPKPDLEQPRLAL